MTHAAAQGGVGHGKVILLGEHAVVYGQPALAAALPNGVRATAAPADAWMLRVPAWDLELGVTDDADLARAFAAVVRDAGEPRLVEADVQLPAGAGLGCSAALGVAVLRAVDDARGVHASAAEVAERSLAWERVFHGTPSGVDSALAAAGGLRWFVKGAPLEAVAAARSFPLVVAHSGEPGSTKATVAAVREQHRSDPARLEAAFDEIGRLVRAGRAAVEAGDLDALGAVLDDNQVLLRQLGVSTPRLDELADAARRAGALGAKLTGGGGGGCLIALARTSAEADRVRDGLAALGADAFVVEVGSWA